MSPSSPKLTTKSGSKGSRILGGPDGVEATKEAAAKQSSKRPGRRRVTDKRKPNDRADTVSIDVTISDSGRPLNDAPRQIFGDNNTIFGGQFTQAESAVIYSINNDQNHAFQLLQSRTATSALHSSIHRVDPPRCHRETRIAILQTIYNWIIQSTDRTTWLLWLNGAAGAGKSAIMQTMAERCVEAAIAIASFFFFRADPRRNTMAPLVATLAYQLIQVIPRTSNEILRTIERHPLIFEESLESQLQQLIIQPLLHISAHLQRPFVIFIDGLDESNNRDDQSNIIKLLGNLSRGANIPIVFIVASRREPQIEAAFLDEEVSSLLQTLRLDNSDVEQTSDDIRHFLTDRFKVIKETHLRRHLLPDNWPPVSGIEEITAKSSGQFIYASVVVNYVSSPRANPAHQLEIVRGLRLRNVSSQNPFVHLDALYRHIFSQVPVESLDKVLDILAFVLITGERFIYKIEATFLLEDGDVEIYLADLTGVVECKPRSKSLLAEIKFLHASLPDFLIDESRSENYYIDLNKYRNKLLCRVVSLHGAM